MRRSSDRPSTVPEALRSSRAGIDELTRRQGRGSEALRNNAGHVLELDPASVNPLLRPQQASGDYVTGMQFDEYGVRVINPDYPSGNGDLTVNAFAAQDYVHALGRVTGAELVSTGGFSAAAGGWFGGTLSLAGQLNMGYNPIYAGNLHSQAVYCTGLDTPGGITVRGTSSMAQINMGVSPIYCGDVNAQTVFYRGLVNASSPDVKEDLRPARDVLGRRLVDVVRDAPVSVFRYRVDDPTVSHMAGTDELGPMADAVPPLLRERFRGPEPDTPSEVDGINLTRMVGVLWGAVGEIADDAEATGAGALSREVAELRSTTESQRQQIDALMAELGQLRAEINEIRSGA